ncbi:hypothetical protein KCP69_22055 [Salmonella enterica subsp. enterica]|nr:hypothetical protein KCP69_22055 [Salmonella enterica subsp. enterica]
MVATAGIIASDSALAAGGRKLLLSVRFRWPISASRRLANPQGRRVNVAAKATCGRFWLTGYGKQARSVMAGCPHHRITVWCLYHAEMAKSSGSPEHPVLNWQEDLDRREGTP